MAVEAVIFDFGGVFTTSPVENFAAFERARGLPERFIGEVIKKNHHANAWARFERAEIDLDAFDRLFAEETRAAGFEIRGKTLVGLMSLTFRPEMIAALERVKAAGFRTGCITNNLPDLGAGEMLAASEKREQLEAIHANFDHVIESSKAGVRKPEPRVYEMMCEALAVAPPACAYLDDLGINLKPAREMGMRTIKVPFGDVRPAIRALEEVLGLSLLD
ncbi:HAD-IA family hydrolase [Amphiplicatus metriothermophilus]|uniref:Putative hydrolase of the HAD superfamily n=1 Tax=Amphiplicatus metriothermophilus TaxID=1519374 RepID=A0A239PYP9_9PROT|nr:HAD-IA family hydrolase [Amphiplicatus metriothermophilus]MBB5519894.1 putative hydrolase of the HAD superfamily [Amphiplicatus metriothermophilus]SNT74797.1 putative hydrolase of the HAD superfamily [Amphiplicatus metriothermophilus]